MTKGYNWVLDEVANAGRENRDGKHASQYDAKEDAGALEELTLLKQLGLNGQSEVVDMGAGTGQFALAAAAACARVVAVDVSPVMLAVLKTKVGVAGLSNVTVVQAGFLTYAHQGRRADFVYSRYALHHLPDFWKAMALQRLRHIIRPGGVLRLWDIVYHFAPSEAEDRLAAWCATIGNDVEEGWTRGRPRRAHPRRTLDLHLALRAPDGAQRFPARTYAPCTRVRPDLSGSDTRKSVSSRRPPRIAATA
jgi:SAM-dependent methyltransferase